MGTSKYRFARIIRAINITGDSISWCEIESSVISTIMDLYRFHIKKKMNDNRLDGGSNCHVSERR